MNWNGLCCASKYVALKYDVCLNKDIYSPPKLHSACSPSETYMYSPYPFYTPPSPSYPHPSPDVWASLLVPKDYYSNVKMELMACQMLFAQLSEKTSLKSSHVLLFGHFSETLQNCPIMFY